MAIEIWSTEWNSVNSQRRFPLAEDGSLTDVSGTFTIPNDFILDLDLPISAGLDVDSTRFFVRTVGAYSAGYGVVIAYQDVDEDPVNVATIWIPRSGHTPGSVYAVGGVSPFQDTLGHIVIGNLDAIDTQPPGNWEFALAATGLDVAAVRPSLQGIGSLYVVNGNQRSLPITGDVELRAGDNCQLVLVQEAGQNSVIRVNFLKGEGTSEPCVCAGESQPAQPIYTVQGVSPAADGNLSLVGDDCITIEPISGGLRIRNTCASPCCGCAELEKITTDLERLGRQKAAVEDFVARLGSTAQAVNTLLGQVLGDQSCEGG